MAKGSERTKESKIKKLREQLVNFKNNPEKTRRIQGKLITLENSK